MDWVHAIVDAWALAVVLIVSVAMLVIAIVLWRELRPDQRQADKQEAQALERFKAKR